MRGDQGEIPERGLGISTGRSGRACNGSPETCGTPMIATGDTDE